MGTLAIKLCTVAAIEAAPDLAALLAEYAAESGNDEIGPARPHLPTYHQMEAAGVMQPIAAYVDDTLVGFMFLLLPVLPHYTLKIGVSESYFVAAAHRKTGAGLKMLRLAEDVARMSGAVGVLVSAPIGGILEQVLPEVGYDDKARVFFKALK